MFLNIVISYKFSLPYKVNWIGQFDNIDVFNNLESCKNAFKSIPILIFKNQKLNNNQYYNFVSSFEVINSNEQNRHIGII
jgi:hypothetical protein